MIDVDVRCPLNPKKLFMRLKIDPAVRIVEGNLIEVDCRDCRRRENAIRVLHVFNALGQLVDTETIRSHG